MNKFDLLKQSLDDFASHDLSKKEIFTEILKLTSSFTPYEKEEVKKYLTGSEYHLKRSLPGQTIHPKNDND